MASLSIRQLDDDIYDLLRERAAMHGISVEEEVRQLLRQAVSPPERLGDLFLKIFGPDRGTDLKIAPRDIRDPTQLQP